MRFVDRGFVFEVSDEWWTEAGMRGFVPVSRSYRVDSQAFPYSREVPISDVDAPRRKLKHGVFNDHPQTGLPAKDRVISILRGFLDDSALPPVEVAKLEPGKSCVYKLTDGAHRFYLSVAAGFTHVPAVDRFEY